MNTQMLFCWRVLLIIVLIGGGHAQSFGQSKSAAEDSQKPKLTRFFHWTYQDAGAFVKAVPTKRSLYVIGAGAGLAALSFSDVALTTRAARIQDEGMMATVEEMGNVKYIRPAAVGLFATSLFTKNTRFQDAAFTSLQAVFFANAITNTLKSVFGRVRPRWAEGARDFRPFSGHTSFPSGHATTAFAFITPWVLYYPNVGTYGLMTVAGGTAFSRLATNMHWVTDIVAGSTIGFTMAYFLVQRHQQRNPRVKVEPQLSLNYVGVTMRF